MLLAGNTANLPPNYMTTAQRVTISINIQYTVRGSNSVLRLAILTEVSGFGGAELACWPLIPNFEGSNPAEAVGFLKGDKNPQHTFLRNGPMSQICGI